MDTDKLKPTVTYRTRLIDVTSMNLVGKVIDGSFYPNSSGQSSLDEALEKFDGADVRILIERLDGCRDDSGLIATE